MKTRILSALLVFLLVISAVAPTAAAPSDVYYDLHNLCQCNASEDLGHIPFLTFGIGYSSLVIDSQTDKWELFVHAGGATKSLLITPDTPTEKIITLRNFVKFVDECEEETVPFLRNIILGGGAGVLAAVLAVDGLRKVNVHEMIEALGALALSAEELSSLVTHFNNAKTAQKNAETLFEAL